MHFLALPSVSLARSIALSLCRSLPPPHVEFLVEFLPDFLDKVIEVGDVVVDDFECRLEERRVEFVFQQLIDFLFRLLGFFECQMSLACGYWEENERSIDCQDRRQSVRQ